MRDSMFPVMGGALIASDLVSDGLTLKPTDNSGYKAARVNKYKPHTGAKQKAKAKFREYMKNTAISVQSQDSLLALPLTKDGKPLQAGDIPVGSTVTFDVHTGEVIKVTGD